MFKTIKPYIDAGWHTVPLKGKLERLPDGSKTLPKFEKDWLEKYTAERNTRETELGGVITGKVSNIVAIDCDNTDTWELFSSLFNLEETTVFKSVGKGDKVCGTILAEYDSELPKTFHVNDGAIALDFYTDNGFIYLPTEANATKAPIDKIRIAKMPKSAYLLLAQLKELADARKQAPATSPARTVSSAMCLAPLVKLFLADKKFMPGLFRIITPKDFRTEPEYVKTGSLHPDNVPPGRGSEYLVKVSAILGADISIDEEMFCAAMHLINKLWSEPMDVSRLEKTILDPMCSGASSINGVSIWKYDEMWETHRLVLTTKRQSSLELGFDDNRGAYYAVDLSNQIIKNFFIDSNVVSFVSTVAYNPPNKKTLQSNIPLINVISDPAKHFGFHENDFAVRDLNTFIRTPELSVFMEPELYKPFYKPPNTTLQFLKSLIPDEQMREYLLGFIKRKLTYFEYSPVILYFLGVQGSGKDTFMEILFTIMGVQSKPRVEEFLEVYNSWLLDKYFVQLDEYGDQLSNQRDKEEVLGKLKTYTGSNRVSIRTMRTDSYSYKHSVTICMTANRQPLMLEDGDRRIALFNTPNKLANEDWVDDVAATHAKILSEVKDFCYYLATEVKMLTASQYTTPPETLEKQRLIATSMYPAAKLAYVLKHSMFDYLKELATDYNCSRLVDAIKNNRIYTEDLEDLYSIMTDSNGDFRSVNKLIKAAGIALKPTTIKGVKSYYYQLAMSPFEETEGEDIGLEEID